MVSSRSNVYGMLDWAKSILDSLLFLGNRRNCVSRAPIHSTTNDFCVRMGSHFDQFCHAR